MPAVPSTIPVATVEPIDGRILDVVVGDLVCRAGDVSRLDFELARIERVGFGLDPCHDARGAARTGVPEATL